MYVGHFAIGLAMKAKAPQIPTWPILMGVGFLDLLDGIFILVGFDHVTADLKSGPYLFFDLTFIDWDHSLLAALAWSAVFAAFFMRERRVALYAALAVLSHFVADWPVHNHDLALYPFALEHMGYGLWGKLGVGAWLLEGVFATVLAAYAWREYGKRKIAFHWPCVLLALLFLELSPWFSPMKYIATLSEPAAHLLHGALVSVGFLVPCIVFTWLLNRSEANPVRQAL